MGNIFYRKEAECIFKNCFEIKKTKNRETLYTSKSNNLFTSKLVRYKNDCKSINVPYNAKTKNGSSLDRKSFSISVAGTTIIARDKDFTDSIKIKEMDIPNIFQNKNTWKYEIINELCRLHRNSSDRSPLISGTIQNNRNCNKCYPGYYLEVDLIGRTPFKNPHTSGVEQEYFLVGKVDKNECNTIVLLETPYTPSVPRKYHCCNINLKL